jgi:hypothetical protein
MEDVGVNEGEMTCKCRSGMVEVVAWQAAAGQEVEKGSGRNRIGREGGSKRCRRSLSNGYTEAVR